MGCTSAAGGTFQDWLRVAARSRVERVPSTSEAMPAVMTAFCKLEVTAALIGIGCEGSRSHAEALLGAATRSRGEPIFRAAKT